MNSELKPNNNKHETNVQTVKKTLLLAKLNALKKGFSKIIRDIELDLDVVSVTKAKLENSMKIGIYFCTSKWELGICRNYKLQFYEQLVDQFNSQMLEYLMTGDLNDMFFLELLELFIQSIDIWFPMNTIVSLISAVLSNLHILLAFIEDFTKEELKPIWETHKNKINTINIPSIPFSLMKNVLCKLDKIKQKNTLIVSGVKLKSSFYNIVDKVPVNWIKTNQVIEFGTQEVVFKKCNYTYLEYQFLQKNVFFKNIFHKKTSLSELNLTSLDSSKDQKSNILAILEPIETETNFVKIYVRNEPTLVSSKKIFHNIIDQYTTYKRSLNKENINSQFINIKTSDLYMSDFSDSQ